MVYLFFETVVGAYQSDICHFRAMSLLLIRLVVTRPVFTIYIYKSIASLDMVYMLHLYLQCSDDDG